MSAAVVDGAYRDSMVVWGKHSGTGWKISTLLPFDDDAAMDADSRAWVAVVVVVGAGAVVVAAGTWEYRLARG